MIKILSLCLCALPSNYECEAPLRTFALALRTAVRREYIEQNKTLTKAMHDKGAPLLLLHLVTTGDHIELYSALCFGKSSERERERKREGA